MDRINREMITSIRTLEVENKSSKDEICELQKQLDLDKNGKLIINKSKGNGMELNSGETMVPKNKLLIVAGKHGKHLSSILHRQFDGKYLVQSILKPDATDKELLETAVLNSNRYSEDDVVILWPFKMGIYLQT